MAFGVSQARFSHYLGGMALGVIPKIALVAFAGGSLVAAFKGSPVLAILGAVAAIAVFIGLGLYARSRLPSSRQTVPLVGAETVDSDTESAD